MDSDCQQIAEAFRTMSRAAMAINEILGRRDDLNKSVPVDWPLQLSAGEFASECLGMAAHYEGLGSPRARFQQRHSPAEMRGIKTCVLRNGAPIRFPSVPPCPPAKIAAR